jgi:ATP-dependent DNA ligase
LLLIALLFRLGLEGLVSKHRDRPYRGGRQKHWIKVKNRKHPAMDRIIDFQFGRRT